MRLESLSFRAAKAQRAAPEEFCRALEEEAQRWFRVNKADPGVRVLRLASSALRQLDAAYRKKADECATALGLVLFERQRVKGLSARNAVLEREVLKLRADNHALSAVASGRRNSRTHFLRDGNGELLEAKTVFEDLGATAR